MITFLRKTLFSKQVLLANVFVVLVLSNLIMPVFGQDGDQGGPTTANDGTLLVGFGRNPITNYANCPSGYKNLLESIDAGTTIANGRLTGAILKSKIYSTFKTPEAAQNVCIKTNVTNFIYRVMQDTDGCISDNLGNNATCKDNLDPSRPSVLKNWFDVPRPCPAGWDAQEATYTITGVSKFWGCCPNGFKFTNVSQESTDVAYQAGVCCRVKQNFKEPYYYKSDEGCMDANGTLVNKKVNPKYKTVEDFETNIAKEDFFEGLDSSPVERTPLGLRAGSSRLNASDKLLIEGGGVKGATTVCPSTITTGCVALSDLKVTSPGQLRTDSSLKAAKCYGVGEAMAIGRVDSNQIVTTQANEEQNLVYCSADGQAQAQPLINGNVQDTLAYLRADEANRDYLKDCRERGGIYIFLGCVDPSPVGVLTGLIRIAFGVMGGVALVQLILAGIAYQSGDEAKISEARERVIATISGVAVLVFSVLILRILGVNVLDILPAGSI